MLIPAHISHLYVVKQKMIIMDNNKKNETGEQNNDDRNQNIQPDAGTDNRGNKNKTASNPPQTGNINRQTGGDSDDESQGEPGGE
jgi:hypothetical protein